MNLGLMKRRAAQKYLPYDAEVEYLYFCGNCRINTGYVPFGDDIRIKTKIKFIGYTDNNAALSPWFSAYTNETTDAYRICRNGSDTSIRIMNGAPNANGYTTFTVDKNTVYEIDMNRRTCIINGTSVSLNYFGNNQNTRYLYLGTAKVLLYYYYFQAFKNDNLIIDYIPVRLSQVGYMYNKVSGQLFGNDLTGSFILGNDV